MSPTNRQCRNAIDHAMRWVNANPDHLVIAGSAALWIEQNYPRSWTPNDVDVFAYGFETTKHIYSPSSLIADANIKKIIAPSELDENKLTHKGKFSTCEYNYPLIENVKYENSLPIQIILGTYFESINDVLNSFDISAAMVGYNSKIIYGPKHTGSKRVIVYYDPSDHLLLVKRRQERVDKYDKYINIRWIDYEESSELQRRFTNAYSNEYLHIRLN